MSTATIGNNGQELLNKIRIKRKIEPSEQKTMMMMVAVNERERERENAHQVILVVVVVVVVVVVKPFKIGLLLLE